MKKYGITANKKLGQNFLIDDNVLEEKDSPFDRGKEVFEELYKNRIRVR